MNMRFDPKPGILVDLFFSFSLHYLKDDADSLENFINPKKRAADMKHFSDCLACFDEPAPGLQPFFAFTELRCFAFSNMMRNAVVKRDFTVKGVRMYLSDSTIMLEEILRFYLPDIRDVLPPIENLAQRIRALAIPESIKYHLLSMAIDPNPYYALLIGALERRMPQVQKYYDDRAAVVKKAIDEADRAFIREFLVQRYSLSDGNIPVDTVISGMLMNKNAIRLIQKEAHLLLLGSDYAARMKGLIGESIKPDIIKLGKALSEEKRVQILQMLLVEKEITAQQLVQRLELSMTATHYHLELLLQTGMLLTRNEGRTIFYSLNRTYFDRAPIVFEEYAHPEEP